MSASNSRAEQSQTLTRARIAALGAAAMLLALCGQVSAQGRYKDGEFVGNPADTNWGPVQVKAVVRNGALADVQFIQYPYHRRRSAEISSWALPALRNEAIRAQSARVDIVSQATLTAYGFQESLANALSQAGKQTY